MNDSRTTRRTDPAGSLRARRGTAAVVAQYIHELSGRHTASKPRARTPDALGQGADPALPPEAPTEALGGPRP